MGCVSGKGCDSDKKPVHDVVIPAFEMGQYEVAFSQQGECVKQKGCRHKPNDRWGGGDRPVINVSWNDVQEYASWLSKKTGNCINTDQANHNGGRVWDAENCSKTDIYREKTMSVGSFAENDFDLFYMHGNVWEWV